MTSVNSSLAGQLDTSGLTVGTPTVANVAMASATTEYSYALPSGTKVFKLQNRSNGLIQFAFTATESSTKYWTVFPGQQYCDARLSGSISITLYFQSPAAGQTLEVVSWS